MPFLSDTGHIKNTCEMHPESMQDASRMHERCVLDPCEHYIGAELYRTFIQLKKGFTVIYNQQSANALRQKAHMR